MADDAAVAAGVTVTVSSGDAGVTNTIGSPATDPADLGRGHHHLPVPMPRRGSAGSTTPAYGLGGQQHQLASARAASTRTGQTVDVVAPGDLNWALCYRRSRRNTRTASTSPESRLGRATGGTSESAPLTAGVAALVIQAYAKAHGGTDPTPAVVKQIIEPTAEDIDAPGRPTGGGTARRLCRRAGGRVLPGPSHQADRPRPAQERRPSSTPSVPRARRRASPRR